MVYVDGTKGWIPVEEGTGNIGAVPTFISASGEVVLVVLEHQIVFLLCLHL